MTLTKAMPPARQRQRHHSATTIAGSIAMTIEEIKQTELTANGAKL